MTARNDGKRAEDRAAAHLESLGYRVVARNWRGRHGELDIVAEHDGVLCFVEVRERGPGARVSALASIDARKRRRVVRAAQEFVVKGGHSRRPARFDVVAIEADGALTHLRGAFTADG